MNRYPVLAVLFGAACFINIDSARAAPPICSVSHNRYVGDKASDTNCTDDSIQDAIDNVTCPDTTIYITHGHEFTSLHLAIDNKSIILVGEAKGVKCGAPQVICDPDVGNCGSSPPPTAPLYTLDGGGSGGRVLSIGGNSNVTLKYLTITGGSLNDNPHGDGGGIGFEGTGSLTLDTSTVENNAADYGGGINFKGTGDAASGPPAVLTLGKNTLVNDNTADVSGGGIRIEGDARLLAIESGTMIYGNHAPGGYGGGIEVLGPAVADIGSPGYAGLPVVDWNDAEYGGGIAVIGVSDNGGDADNHNAQVRIFATDPRHPVQVSNNTATHTGGGIFVQPNTTGPAGTDTVFADATLCASSYRIDGNVAQEGAAIYGDTDSYNGGLQSIGASISLTNTPNRGWCDSPASLGAVACAPGVACNTVNGNSDRDSSDDLTVGSTILVQDSGGLAVYGLRMQDNRGAHAIRMLGGFPVDIQDCLLTDNTFSSELLHFEGDYRSDLINVRGCTMANNSLGSGSSLIDSSQDLKLWESILGDDARPATMENGATLYPGSLLTVDIAGLPDYDSIVQGTASFVDAAHGDYHLLPTSLGLDFAPTGGGIDLDGRPRDVDLAGVPNVYGPRDLGAYERQSDFACDGSTDAIFCNGFEQP
jgi:predicted outer membrane repeat protein